MSTGKSVYSDWGVSTACPHRERIEQAVPASAVAGTRYDERQMGMLDSER